MSGAAIVEQGVSIMPEGPPPELPNGGANGNGVHADANGGPHGAADIASAENYDLLNALQAMRVGDFSVRLAGHQTGLAGKIAVAPEESAIDTARGVPVAHCGLHLGRSVILVP